MWLAITEQEGLKVRLNDESLDFDIAGGGGLPWSENCAPHRGKRRRERPRRDAKRRLKRKRASGRRAEKQRPVVKRGLGAPLVGQR